MPANVTSKSLRTATELTLVADIKPGFVPTTDLMSYVARLGLLLRVLFELRKRSVEQRTSGYAGPLEKLRSLHFVRWSIIEGGRKLLLGVSFDRAWEPYIRGIVDEAGPFLDVIFCHCTDYAGSSTGDGYAKFADWVREHQADVSFFYAGAPDTTVDDQRYLRELERRLDDPKALSRIVVGDPGKDDIPPMPPADPADLLDRLGRAYRALSYVREYFPDGDDRTFFDRAAFQLLEDLIPRKPGDTVKDALGELPPKLGKPLSEMHGKLARDIDIPAEQEAGLEDDLQGNVLTAYSGMTHGCLALLRFDDASSARAFLSRIQGEITTDREAATAERTVNVSLTLNGLRTLGLSESEISRFPKEFRDGMESRAGLLGDVDAEHPANWERPLYQGQPIAFATVDLVLSLQVRRESVKSTDHVFGKDHPLAADLEKLVTGKGVHLLHAEPLLRKPQPESEKFMKEHFGFADGISQPVPRTRASGESTKHQVALGELVLGYRDDRGETYPGSTSGLLRHGSFLVVRKIEQHVRDFHAFVKEHAGVIPEPILCGKLMGRDQDGRPLVGSKRQYENEFDYSQDPEGDACPLHAHVRRSNPRLPDHRSVHGRPVRTPRILRRGFSYGPVDPKIEDPRGLMFMAYNASIADQFEVVQRWINGGNSSGDFSGHADPVASHAHDRKITVAYEGTPYRLEKKKPFVTLRWGMYLFTPSNSALKTLAARTEADDAAGRKRDQDALAAEGHKIIKNLETLALISGNDAAKTAWKAVLEDRLLRDKARAVWAAIRSRGGALTTPYGTLVGSAQGVRDVLTDDKACSVREYFHRMSASVGPLYLGMDRCPVRREEGRTSHDAEYEESVHEGDYDARATKPNAFMWSITREDAFEAGRAAAEMVLTGLRQETGDERPHIDLRVFAGGAVSSVSRAWFGLPTEPTDRTELKDVFLIAAQSIFYPHPEKQVVEHAARVRELMEHRKLEETALAFNPKMVHALSGFDDEQKKRALVGGAQGFLIATMTSFISVMLTWIENGEAYRMAQWLRTDVGRALATTQTSASEVADDVPFVRAMLEALRAAPQPDILHRTVVIEKRFAGGTVTAKPGDTIAISLASAVADEPAAIDLLFGGEYSKDKTGPVAVHACPGKEAAIGVILGLLVSLLSKNDFKSDGLTWVSFKP